MCTENPDRRFSGKRSADYTDLSEQPTPIKNIYPLSFITFFLINNIKSVPIGSDFFFFKCSCNSANIFVLSTLKHSPIKATLKSQRQPAYRTIISSRRGEKKQLKILHNVAAFRSHQSQPLRLY